MTTMERATLAYTRVTLLAVALAFAAAVAYVLIGLGLLGVGDLQTSGAPTAIPYLAAGGYVLGALLIPLHRRGLLLTGAVINALIILVFVQAYAQRMAVLFSPGGLATKSAELLLEVSLLYLLVRVWRRPQSEGAG